MSTTLMPVSVDAFETRRRHIGPKVTTVTRKAAVRRQKTMTVTRMATPRGPIGGGYQGGGWVGNAECRRIYRHYIGAT